MYEEIPGGRKYLSRITNEFTTCMVGLKASISNIVLDCEYMLVALGHIPWDSLLVKVYCTIVECPLDVIFVEIG